MGRAIKKVANSADPRDWHYLKHWQTWARSMPPLKYRWSAPGSCPSGHFMDSGNYVPPLDTFLSSWTDNVYYFDFIIVNVPSGPTPFFVKSVFAKIQVFDPNSTLPLDPDGLPYNWHLRIEIFDGYFHYTSTELFALNMPYDFEIYLPMLDNMGNPNPLYPNGITMTPVLWSTPDTPLTASDICP